MREEKTNVMRLLEQKKVPYTPHQYAHSEGEAVDGATVAGLVGKDPAAVFKTLVTRGAAKANYVFVIPVLAELDLKKAAKAVGEKSIEMIPVKELTLSLIHIYLRGRHPPPNWNGASVIRSAIWGPSPYAGPPESSPVRFFRILGNFHRKTRPVTVAAQMSAMGSAR